jgi:hypothetical protein
MRYLFLTLMFLSSVARADLTNLDSYIFDSNGNAINLGQTTMANGLPVALASNQSAIPVSQSGSWTNACTQSGTWTVQQGATPTALANGWPVKVTDGTNTQPTGDVAARKVFVQPTDGTNSQSYTASGEAKVLVTPLTNASVVKAQLQDNAGTAVILGQTTMASSLPIAIASNQSNVPVSQATASSLNAQVVGNVASGSADSGNPVKIGVVYNSTLPTPSTGQRIDAQADLNGRQLVAAAPLDGYKTTYTACSGSFVIAALATDVFYLQGSATKTVRVLHAEVSGSTTSGSGALAVVSLIKRSAANTGGTSTAITIASHDSTNAATTAASVFYTVNPTVLGAAVGTIRSQRADFTAAGAVGTTFAYDFGITPGQAIVLRGTSQFLVINFNATTVTGGNMDICFDFTEE